MLIKKGKKLCIVLFNVNVIVILIVFYFYYFDIFILEKEKYVVYICVFENEF